MFSTKKLGPISTSHRNWRAADSENRDATKCSWCHGYSRYIKFTFQGEVDERGWVFDFGDTKFIKEWLDHNWDHKTLVSDDDPELEYLKEMDKRNILKINIIDTSTGWNPGMEGCGKWVYDCINPIVLSRTNNRVSIAKIEIWEHEGNSACYVPND